jgi:signal transduction histidine kinase
MLRIPAPPWRRSAARGGLIALVGLALVAMVAAGVRPLLVAGRTPEARWARIERDVRSRLNAAFDATRHTAAALARDAVVARALATRGEEPQELFRAIEQHVRHPAASLAVTILDASGAARAWHGRPSELSRGAMASHDGASDATASALGFRVVRFEPVADPSRSRRLGTVVVEQVVSEARVGSLVSEAFQLTTAGGDVILRPIGRGEVPHGTLSFSIAGPGGAPLILATSDRGTLERTIAADRAFAWATLLAALAVGLVLLTGPFLDMLALAATGRRVILAALAIGALLGVARLLLWIAWPRIAPGALTTDPAVRGPAALFLRSPMDLGLTAALLLAFAALAANLSGRARIAWRHRRRAPGDAWLRFGFEQLLAGLIVAGLLAACDVLLSRSVMVAGIESLSLSLHQWSAARGASLAGIILLETGVLWLAAATLTAALARWRLSRRALSPLPLAFWLAAAAVVSAAVWRRGSGLSLSFALGLLVVFAAGLLAGRVTTRYRRAGASARLLAFALALLAPSLLAYPVVVAASQHMTRSLVENTYSDETLKHRDELLETLETAEREIDSIANLPQLARGDGSGVNTEPAFVVWSETALARRRLTSSVELYGPDGRLVSRFALNFPEYEASAQITRSETCTWRLFGLARPFGAEDRAALHAERAICSDDGSIAGSIVVHVMLDYNALPFISPESPYREVFRAEAPGRDPGHPREIALVIYGWSLLPIYSSGGQVWPISEQQFDRLYASREGFWSTVPTRDETWHVYFVNDRSGVYALGYPALAPFDHLVQLAELTVLATALYVAGLALMGIFNRVTRGRGWTRRALLRDVRASFYRKLLIAFVAASVIPVLALALVIRTYFATRLRADVNAEAARTATVARHALEELAALLRLAGLSAPPINDDLMVEVSQMIGRDVNVFEGASLLATSQRDLFASGLLPTRTPEDVYRELMLERRPTYVGEDSVGDLRYLIAAAPVRATGRDAVITVPLASRQQEIEREIEELDRGLLLAVLLFIGVGAAIGLPTAERIADPIRRLTRASRRVAAGDFDTRVAVKSIDELRRLVDAFNQMAAELKTQQQQLERTHRLEAWAEMARQVAHEIKNPLTPIQLSAEHLRRVHADRGQPLSPVLEGCVESILGQVRILRQIAGEFSSFASSPTARPGPVNVPALLDEVVAPYRTGLEGRIDVRVEAPAALPDVMADRGLLGRAITNVVENALHAMPGRGALHIMARHDDGHVAIAVQDTGVGMDEEALSRVFEPYFSTKATGTGLGLTIASRNVELSGGSIAVASRKGEGTTVTIRLRVVAP